MREKTKIVELDGARYQIRRMSPEVGSYIVMQIMKGVAKASASSGAPEGNEKPPEIKSAPEEIARAMSYAALSQGVDFDTHVFIQRKSISVCSRMEERDGVALPMPIMSDAGVWAIAEIRDDAPLVFKLEIESLVFNLSDFFGGGGL